MKTLLEIYTNILTSVLLNDAELDSEWFADIDHRRDLKNKNPKSFAYYNADTDNPMFPVVNKNGEFSQKQTLMSLKLARTVKMKNAESHDIDEVIDRLEKMSDDIGFDDKVGK